MGTGWGGLGGEGRGGGGQGWDWMGWDGRDFDPVETGVRPYLELNCLRRGNFFNFFILVNRLLMRSGVLWVSVLALSYCDPLSITVIPCFPTRKHACLRGLGVARDTQKVSWMRRSWGAKLGATAQKGPTVFSRHLY